MFAKLLLPPLLAALAQDLSGGGLQYQSSFIKGEVGVHPNHYFQMKLAPGKYDGWFYLQNDLHCAPGRLLGINGTASNRYLYVGVDNGLGYVYIRRDNTDPRLDEVRLTVFADCTPTRRMGEAEAAGQLRPMDEAAPEPVRRLAQEADAKAERAEAEIADDRWADSLPVF